MLTIIYKLIASILSKRVSTISKDIISPQLTGFILENISLALMTIEWMTKKQIPTLHILLDFEKAFDRVEHPFLWLVLENIGLGGTFLTLVKGLLVHAISKVHVNGRFMEEIPLTRGVWQGCPLSPILFVLSTQSLMDYIDHTLRTVSLEGVKIIEDITICHRLFADDLSIFIPMDEKNFANLQHILKLYEMAAGAKMNLSKTIIIPLGMSTIP